MFVRIVHHWAKPGQTEIGREFIDANGEKMASVSGFKYRYRLEPPEGPTFITTLTAWDSEDSFLKFKSTQAPYSENPDYPFERVETKELFVQSTTGADPA